MFGVRAAQQALLDRGGSGGSKRHRFGVDVDLAEQVPDRLAFRIIARDGHHADIRFQSRQHGRHAAGPAQAIFLPVDPQHGDRCLGADPLDVAEDVPVEHHIAGDKDSRAAFEAEQFDQLTGHRQYEDLKRTGVLTTFRPNCIRRGVGVQERLAAGGFWPPLAAR